MFVTNTRTKAMTLNYKVGTAIKKVIIAGNSQVEITDLGDVTKVIFNSYDKRLRDLKAKFPNRGILGVVELLEFRNTASGPLV